MLRICARLGARWCATALLPTSDAFNLAHGRDRLHGVAPFTKGAKPPFHTPLDNFAKLRLWQLTEYERVVFLDADTLMVRNCDKLFGYPEFCAAPNVYESVADFHRMNSGRLCRQSRRRRRSPRCWRCWTCRARSGGGRTRRSCRRSFRTGTGCR
jgi:alpha-N-acetylglucosamine transferase